MSVWKGKGVCQLTIKWAHVLINKSFYSGKSSSGKTGSDTKGQSRSGKAGLQFPVGRIHRLLKRGNYAQRVGAGAPGVLQWSDHQRNRSHSKSQFTLPLSLSTLLPRFLNSQAMLLAITRSSVSFLVTFNSPFETMKSKFGFPLSMIDLTRIILRLNKLLGHVVISQGGVVPNINPELLPSKSMKKKDGASQEV